MRSPLKILAAIPVVVALLLPTSAFASYRFRGVTSQQEYVSFLLNKRVTRLTKFQIAWDATCTSGATLGDGAEFNRVSVNRGLRFLTQGAYSYTMVDPDYSAANGRNLDFEVRAVLSGHYTRSHRMRGTWQAVERVFDPATSQQVDTCSTGRISWTALMH
jgi:hypothetical protein